MAKSFMSFNISDGFVEALVHGYRAGILTETDYTTLIQCDTIEDMKVHLATTSYGNFLQNEPVPISPSTMTDKALEKLVEEFNLLSSNAAEPLATFLDYITYEYMIANVLKVISGARNGHKTLELINKCHPLGMFDTIGALSGASTVEDMYELVLVDSPIGRFFSKTDRRDFDELSMEYIRCLLLKNYYESFYDFCMELGGETADVMKNILEFEADRTVITITRNTLQKKELPKDDRRKLFPNFGKLVDVHDDLGDADNDETVQEIIAPFPEYNDLFKSTTEEESVENKFIRKAVSTYKDAFEQQFQYGSFYAWVKLKEREIHNLMWIAECIRQDMKHRINEYVPIY
eukprot:gb/GECH01011636.1/.p1 GENE.gb/GECH01011636.1/~~gb/GECH01011636.1/.p1  ORF type:complete len:347 (+),score=79.90 gb/GECH01011636.1/:1-1041(+)